MYLKRGKTLAEFTEKISAICPYCKKNNTTYVHPVVSSKTNPILSKRIINDSFFERKCKHCEKKFLLDFSTLYRNDEYAKTICYAHSTNDYVEFITSVEETREIYEKDGLFCSVRVVRDRNDLREKARLASKGLDDRVIEVIKVWGIESLRKMGYHGSIERVLCWADDNETIEFEFFGNQEELYCLVLEMNKYYETERKLKPLLKKFKTNNTTIDLDWAINFVTEHEL